jgi:hypothetical protein
VKPEDPVQPEGPGDQEQQQPEVPVLVGCTSWSGPGRLCRYVWGDGLVEWFTGDMVHQKGRGLATRPE